MYYSQLNLKKMKKVFIAVLAIASFASCKKESTTAATAKDINTAEKVSVDRFAVGVGHLMVRTATNGMPAANAAVSFDVIPFVTKGFSPTGAMIEYYNFDEQPATPNNIYVLFKAGAAAPIAGQNNIIPTIPGDAGYTDFWLVNKVTVPDNYVPNSITSEAEITASGYAIEKTTSIVNCPVVPFGSTANRKFGSSSASSLSVGWYKNKAVAYFSFEEAAVNTTASGKVPTSPIFVMFNSNATGPASGVKTEMGTTQSHNVVATMPGSAGYSPLWMVHMVDNADFATVLNLASAQSANILNPNAALVNCPVVKQ